MAKSKKDSIVLTKNGFIALLLFVVAGTIIAAYAFLNFTAIR